VKCNWCGKGYGSNRTKDKEGKLYYYVCAACVGDFTKDKSGYYRQMEGGGRDG